MLRDHALEEVQKVLTIRGFGVDQLALVSFGSVLTHVAYPIDGCNLETKSTTCKVGSIQVITHHQDDVEQLAE